MANRDSFKFYRNIVAAYAAGEEIKWFFSIELQSIPSCKRHMEEHYVEAAYG